ncbi:DUF4136 domain-containing protein [Aquimarina mytili]|uniref:DUF4136 domain-containing protein n=1 Tax=Aquimarina mytili TaxID=874423 RepID=A0A936ZYZ7_9FLAO|nr:DUF4136 domain-containing protein [Aquimarina mytili]MBL0684480.1 DUF4136 domain-containing protein [Aquimarina mytili]
MKQISLLFFLLILTSCGSTYVVHDYDEQQDFIVYKTYDFFSEMDSGLTELDHKRLLAVTEAAMQDIGLTKSENPDIYIDFKTIIKEGPSRNSIGVGVGSGGGGVNIGIGGAIPIGGPQTFLEVTTDFVDAKKGQLVWQAIAERRFFLKASPDSRISFFQKIMQKSLAKYPPAKAN